MNKIDKEIAHMRDCVYRDCIVALVVNKNTVELLVKTLGAVLSSPNTSNSNRIFLPIKLRPSESLRVFDMRAEDVVVDYREIIISAVNKINEQEHLWDKVDGDTILRGDKSPLDSLAFLRLIVEIERGIEQAAGKKVSIFKPEFFLGKSYNPYATIESLAALVSKIVGDNSKSAIVKIIFTDLDGTLWDGVAGEDIGQLKIELLKELCRLNREGVLIVPLTKNYKEIVEPYFDDQMRDMFTFCQYNCIDKASAIRSTCESLGLGLDSAVFLDDSEHERDYVRSALPEVTVYDNHMDVAYINFESVSADAKRRTEMYRQEYDRAKSKPVNSAEYGKWLETLDMVLTAKTVETQGERVRAEELIDRSNQFNFGKDRPGDYTTVIFSLKDKFGDMGVVSVVNVSNRYAYNFCVSCRALGRGVEKTVADHIASNGYVLVEPVPSGRNKAALDFWNGERKEDKKYPIKVIEL